MNIINILSDISIGIVSVPLLYGLLTLKHLDRDSKLILLLIFIASFPQLLRPYLIKSNILELTYNLYTPLEFSIYLLLFAPRITVKTSKLFFYLSCGVFFVGSLWIVSANNISLVFINQWVILNNIINIFWIGLCLYEYYVSDSIELGFNQPFFWFITGIFIYASSTTVFYSLWNIIVLHNPQRHASLRFIHHIANILLYVFFLVGFIKSVKTSRKNRMSYESAK